MQLYKSIANSKSRVWIRNFNSRDVVEMVRYLGLQTACEKLFSKVLSVCCFTATDDLSVFPNLTRVRFRNCIISQIPPELDQKVQGIHVKLNRLPINMNELPSKLTSLFLIIEEGMNIVMDCVRAFDSLSQACPQLQFLRPVFPPKTKNNARKAREIT